MSDIDRGGQLQRQQLGAQAAATWPLAALDRPWQAKLNRNLMDQKARTSGQLRMAGYGQATQQAQQAFEAAQQRRQRAAQLAGGLGQQAAGPLCKQARVLVS